MRLLSRAWDSMSSTERIVGMAVTAGSVVAIANSTIWAVAVSYMRHQKMRVELARIQTELPQAPGGALASVPGAGVDGAPQGAGCPSG
ncbi:MAG: hypothetical protein IVW57_07800 [Ktedonobacterales bacterium]|nr:hypothetical protein [Ktedonobacterales bacterium]